MTEHETDYDDDDEMPVGIALTADPDTMLPRVAYLTPLGEDMAVTGIITPIQALGLANTMLSIATQAIGMELTLRDKTIEQRREIVEMYQLYNGSPDEDDGEDDEGPESEEIPLD